jgi:hypothetical protein
MYPTLVEPTIHSILQHELKQSREKKFIRNSLWCNIWLSIILFSSVGLFLWVHYKGKQDIPAQIKRERERREYIFTKLNYYRRIKEQEYSGIPFLSK